MRYIEIPDAISSGCPGASRERPYTSVCIENSDFLCLFPSLFFSSWSQHAGDLNNLFPQVGPESIRVTLWFRSNKRALVSCSLWDTSCTTEWIERALDIDRDINSREIRKQGMRIWVISYTAHVYRLIYIHSLIVIFVAKSVKDKISIEYRNASLIFPSYFSIILNFLNLIISLHHVF